MSRFLALTNIIINKNVIHHIEINKDKIMIHLMTNKFNNGIFLFSSCKTHSYNTNIELCKNKNSINYKIVADWINNELKK
jgi:hypothetical protein